MALNVIHIVCNNSHFTLFLFFHPCFWGQMWYNIRLYFKGQYLKKMFALLIKVGQVLVKFLLMNS